MIDCLFCKILKGEIPSKKVFENEEVYAFQDIAPMSKVHLLFVHKNHTSNISEVTQESPEQLASVFSAITEYASSDENLKKGFRVVNNQGSEAGQTVFHTHFHVLGGERLGKFGA